MVLFFFWLSSITSIEQHKSVVVLMCPWLALSCLLCAVMSALCMHELTFPHTLRKSTFLLVVQVYVEQHMRTRTELCCSMLVIELKQKTNAIVLKQCVLSRTVFVLYYPHETCIYIYTQTDRETGRQAGKPLKMHQK